MTETQTDVFQELVNEIRSLRVAVEHGQNTDGPLTLKEAAAYLRLHEDTVARWARDGRLSYSRLGDGERAPLRFLRCDLDRFNDRWRIPAVAEVTCKP